MRGSSPWNPDDRPLPVRTVFITCALLLGALAGCTGPEDPLDLDTDGQETGLGPDTGQTENGVSDENASAQDSQVDGIPEGYFPDRYEQSVSGAHLLVITRPTENRTVTLQTLNDDEEVRQMCLNETGYPPVGFHYKVYNRTGLTHYEQRAVEEEELDQEITVPLELPPDPPYIVNADFCPGLVLTFHAQKWSYTGTSTDTVSEQERLEVRLRFPQGETGATAAIAMEKDLYFISSGPAPREPPEPLEMPYGEMWFHGPGQSGDDWLQYDRYSPPDSHSTATRHPMKLTQPGAYTIRAELTYSPLVDTEWRTNVLVHRFTDDLEGLGFQTPFRDHLAEG